MSSVRLRIDQISRLRESGCGPDIIRAAVARYKRGDFGTLAIQGDVSNDNLAIYPLWKKPDVTDRMLRSILDEHWKKTDYERLRRLQQEIEYWKKIAEFERAKIAAAGPYILVPNKDE